MGEHWKSIPSAPGWLASSKGRVCMPRREQAMPRGGFRTVAVVATYGHLDAKRNRYKLSVGGRTRWIAPLICEAFHGPRPFPKAECMHSDENSANNAEGNLAWGTKQQNSVSPKLIAARSVRLTANNPRRKLWPAQVAAILAAQGRASANDVALRFGVTPHHVRLLWRGLRQGAVRG